VRFPFDSRVSGTATDGVYEFRLTLPQFSEQGTWFLQSGRVADGVGNEATLTRAELEATGIPTTFEVKG
jgi:hypothetical protein